MGRTYANPNKDSDKPASGAQRAGWQAPRSAQLTKETFQRPLHLLIILRIFILVASVASSYTEKQLFPGDNKGRRGPQVISHYTLLKEEARARDRRECHVVLQCHFAAQGNVQFSTGNRKG